MNRKGFTPVVLLVVIVVIIVAALVAWYVTANSRPKQTSLNSPPVVTTSKPMVTANPTNATSSAVDTSNWKTYTNSQWGIQFKYPIFTTQDKVDAVETSSTLSLNFDSLNGGYVPSNFSFYFETATSSLPLKHWFEQNVDYNGLLLSSGAFKSESLVGGEAIIEDFNVPIPQEYLNYLGGPVVSDLYLAPSSMAYVGSFIINGADSGTNWESYLTGQQLTQGILSTFQFASSTQGQFCGGIATGAFPCPTGYSCQLNGTYPDAGGHCVATNATNSSDTYSYALNRIANSEDAEIVQTDSMNGKQVVLIPSIKAAIPALQSNEFATLAKLSFPAGSPNLYFQQIIDDSDAPPGDVYAFNIATKQFTKLKSNLYISGDDITALSPNGLFLASEGSPNNNEETQKLVLINLEQDSVTPLLTLTGSESMNYCGECEGDNAGEITWLNNQTIQYAVYDSSKAEDQNGMLPLISTRTFSIPASMLQ